jgi:hypothetical protein
MKKLDRRDFIKKSSFFATSKALLFLSFNNLTTLLSPSIYSPLSCEETASKGALLTQKHSYGNLGLFEIQIYDVAQCLY